MPGLYIQHIGYIDSLARQGERDEGQSNPYFALSFTRYRFIHRAFGNEMQEVNPTLKS
ncbi:hypothetical protein [Bacteroides sp.]|uniref:hypothetical protein n=1 Tax=Bacteroides sp. TaxID=29523 RepID=UPI0025C129E0|nr:hypothetical protein [Bacteroides sp.]